jgi:hypothetical protein
VLKDGPVEDGAFVLVVNKQELAGIIIIALLK